MKTALAHWVWERKVPLLASIACVLLCYVVSNRMLRENDKHVLRLSAGSRVTRREAVAEYLREQAAKNQLSIQLIENAGTEASLQQLKSGQLDAAIVSGGIVVPEDDDVMVLAAMQVEAVHVLVRKHLAGDAFLAESLHGKRINLGRPGSAEWLLSRAFLEFVHVKLPSEQHPGDVVVTEFSKADLVSRAAAIQDAQGEAKERLLADMPDCILLLATMPSTVALTLMEAADYQIMPLPATRAFLLDNLQESESTVTIIEREFLESTVIPARSYFAHRPLPAQDCETVGTRLLLVARRDVPEGAIRPLMKTLFEGEFARRQEPKSPREFATPYAVHPAAEAYLDRDKPLVIRSLIETLSTGLSIFGAFSAGALSLYGLVWRKKPKKASDYYAEIRKLELLAHNSATEISTHFERHEFAKYLHDQLLKLRQELIEDICEGRIEGDHVIANILGLLNDSRQNLSPFEHVAFPRSPMSTPLDRTRTPLRRAS